MAQASAAGNHSTPPSTNGHRRIVATYRYNDEHGVLLYEVVRFDPKDFRQRRPDGHGGWLWTLGDVPRVLYRLPELIASAADGPEGRPVFIAEGEKDADALAALELVATTCAMGAGKWRPEYNAALHGRHVFILPDNDDPGRAHAEAVVEALDGVAASVKVVHLPDLPPKGDVSDWLAAGGTKEQLLELVNRGDAWDGPSKRYAGQNGQGEPEDAPPGVLLSNVQPQHVDWLWQHRVPLGKLTIVDGDPGLGKSVLTLDLAARVSTGQNMPDGTAGRQGGVVLLTAEDGLDDTVRPRLDAAGADVARILALDFIPDGVGKRLPALPTDAAYIREAVERMSARLVIVDPLTAYLAPEINSHRDSDCRRALWPLAALAEETGAAVLVVRHLNKAAGTNPLYRGGGSIGIIGAARAGLLVGRDPELPDDRRVLAVAKCNLARPAPSLAYGLGTADNGALRIGWAGVSPYTARDLLAASCEDEERDAVEEAKEVLRTLLANGDLPANEVKAKARQAGVSERTLSRAKAALKVRAKLLGFGKEGVWRWSLPPASEAESARECQT